ncbi:hypothetical protein Droror1_Dr00020412 [Drosera rotundifolia]
MMAASCIGSDEQRSPEKGTAAAAAGVWEKVVMVRDAVEARLRLRSKEEKLVMAAVKEKSEEGFCDGGA